MPTNEDLNEELKEQARASARALLAKSDTFLNLDKEGQMTMYRDTVNAQYNDLLHKPGLVQAQGLSGAMGDRAASRLIDEGRHENTDLDRTGDRARAFMDSVDFPQFVEDLLNGVFDATLNLTRTQMQDYMALLKEATKDVGYFINQIDDAAAFKYLVENNDKDQFDFKFPDEGGDAPPTITDKKSGSPLDQTKVITEAKLKMAEEQRALLREMILMGVSRIVVDRGTVKAAVVFDVKATENIEKTDKASVQEVVKSAQSSTKRNFWGQRKAGDVSDRKRSSISVSTAKSTNQTELSAKITGEVEINFKSDYFKLDNFATMYSRQPQPGQGTGQGQLPAGG